MAAAAVACAALVAAQPARAAETVLVDEDFAGATLPAGRTITLTLTTTRP